MTIPTNTQRVIRLLQERADASPAHEPSTDQSERTIRAMELAMLARRRRTSNVRRAWALAVAAIVLVGVGAGFKLVRQPSTLPILARGDGVSDESGSALSIGARVDTGTGVTTTTKSVTLRYDTGTDVTLAESSRLRLVNQGKQSVFALDRGNVVAHVAKLKADEQFIVRTVDSEVEVRGTQFSVTVVEAVPGCASKTRVDVTEGVVAVRHDGHETLVRAGEHFPVCVPAQPPPTLPSVNVGDLAIAPPRPATHGPSPADTSSLSAQNDLFAEAITQKRSGQGARAAATLATLLAKYPNTPLRENALAERMKLLEAVSPTEAKQAAREYLRSFPQGFARDEATRLAQP